MINRKKVEILLDAGILLTGGLLLITILSGGFQFSIGEKIIGLRSPQNPLILFLLFFSFRSLKYGRPFSHLPWKLQGAAGIWTIISAIIVVMIIYLASIFVLTASNNEPPRFMSLQQVKGFTPESSFNINKERISLESEGQYLLEFRLAAGDTSDYKKIRFKFNRVDGTQNLNSMDVIYKSSAGDEIKGLSIVRLVRGIFVYDLPLVENEFDTIHVVLRSNLQKVNAEISEISLHSPHISDYKYFTSVLALIIAFFLLSPGLLIVSLITAHRKSVTVLLYSLFSASLVFYLLLYGLLELSFLFKISNPGNILIIGLFLSIVTLLSLNFSRDRFTTINHYIYSARVPIFVFIVILLLLTAYVSFNTLHPFQNLGWQSISGPKTFDVFNAHDNYFQFANGRVIAENLPFSVEYGDGKRPLVFMPEDREMLAGVVYAVFRSIGSVVNPFVGNSFMSYTIFGVAMNLMIIFPVIALMQRYVANKSELLLVLLILLLFGNAVIIVQSSMTWFKFSGAALFLSSLLVLLRDKQHVNSWLFAGFLLGLATNMHASIAIGIPFYFLWFVIQRGKETKFQPVQWLSGPMLLMAVFVLVNLPWKLVKKFYLNDSIDLLTGFFFAGHQRNNSLIDSAALFFSKTPISEQFTFRLNNFWQSFRLEELSSLPGILYESGMESFLLQWTQYEVGYTVFLYYPLLLLLLIIFAVKALSFSKSSTPVATIPDVENDRKRELTTLVLIGVATHLALVVSAFSYNHPPDISWVQPYGVTIMVYLGMLLLSLRNRFFTGILVAYVLFVYVRLYFAYWITPFAG